MKAVCIRRLVLFTPMDKLLIVGDLGQIFDIIEDLRF